MILVLGFSKYIYQCIGLGNKLIDKTHIFDGVYAQMNILVLTFSKYLSSHMNTPVYVCICKAYQIQTQYLLQTCKPVFMNCFIYENFGTLFHRNTHTTTRIKHVKQYES